MGKRLTALQRSVFNLPISKEGKDLDYGTTRPNGKPPTLTEVMSQLSIFSAGLSTEHMAANCKAPVEVTLEALIRLSQEAPFSCLDNLPTRTSIWRKNRR